MKRTALALTFILALLVSTMVLLGTVHFGKAQSSNAPSLQWEHEYSGAGQISDLVKCLIQTSDGGYAFLGTSDPYSGTRVPSGSVLVKTDSSGTVQWQKQFGFTGALGLVQTNDGGYVLAGQDNASSGTVLFKLDSNGNLQWNKTYPYSSNNNPYVGSNVMVATSDGGFALAGTQNSEVWLVKTDSAGNVQWSNTYQETFDRAVNCLMQSQDGGYIMIGASIVNPDFEGSPATLEMLKVNSAGTLLWCEAYDAGISSWDGHSIVQTSDGGYVLTDDTNSSNSHIVFKTNQDGAVEWKQTFASNATTASGIYSVIETSDSGLAFSGMLQSPLGGVAYIWMFKTDSLGNIEWHQTYGNTGLFDGVGVLYYFGGSRIIECSDGSLVVAGGASEGGSFYQAEYYMVKTQPLLPLPTQTPTPTPSPTVTPAQTASPTSSPTTSPTSSNPTATPTATSSPSSSPTSAVPEFPTLIILPLLLSLFSVALVIRHRKAKYG